MKLDKYVKKLRTLPFAKLFKYAQLQKTLSLSDISFELRNNTFLRLNGQNSPYFNEVMNACLIVNLRHYS